MRLHPIALALASLFAIALAACEGTGLPCQATDYGCICASDVAPAEDITCRAPNQGPDGFCCQSTTSDECACVRPACALAAGPTGFCSCGPDLYDGTDSYVAECLPNVGQHCCVGRGFLDGALCTCSRLACLDDQIEVTSCTTDLVAACGDEAELADRCD